VFDGIGQDSKISAYKIDYLLLHYNQILLTEIQKNPDIIKNIFFQKFQNNVMEFRRIVLESRNDLSREARGPMNADGSYGQKKIYSNVYFDNNIRKAIKQIFDERLESKKTSGSMLDPIDVKEFYYYVNFKGKCSERKMDDPNAIYDYINTVNPPDLYNLIVDIIIPTEESYQTYVGSKIITTKKIGIEKINKEVEGKLILFNDVIKNDGYARNNNVIELKLNNTRKLLHELSNTINTQLNIIQNTSKIENYYKYLAFNMEDIDNLLEISDETNDLIDQKQLSKKFIDMIKKNSNDSNIVLAELVNVKPGSSHNDIGNTIINAMNVLHKSIEINDPSGNISQLSLAGIYDFDGAKIAKYLDDNQIKQIQTESDIRQNKFFEKIVDPNVFNDKGVISWSRAHDYQQYYKKQIFC
jgi:hypothetical protein